MKHFPYWLLVLSSSCIFGFLGWSFSFHSTLGLFQVNGLLRMVFIVLGIYGIILLGLGLLLIYIKGRFTGTINRFRMLLLILAIFGIIIPTASFLYLSGVPSSGMVNISPQVYIADGKGSQGIPDVAIVFYTENQTINSLKWGTSNVSYTILEENSSEQHVFMLHNLEPGMEYWYRINDNVDTYLFSTPDLDGQKLRFAVGSDAHFGSGNIRTDLTIKMLEHIANPDNGFSYMFSLGDLVEYGSRDSQWNEALQSLSTTASTIPTKLVVGNHETLFTGSQSFEYFCYPEGMDLQSGSRRWSRIDIGEIHFLVLDLEWSLESYTDEQAEWLKEQLINIPDDDWKIVMSHGFYYASGSVINGWQWYDNQETIHSLVPLFEEYGVDIVFSGHVHQLELLQRSDITYAICSGLGGLPDPERTYISPGSIWYASGQYGYVDVTIDTEEAIIIFRNPDNTELQRITLSKN